MEVPLGVPRTKKTAYMLDRAGGMGSLYDNKSPDPCWQSKCGQAVLVTRSFKVGFCFHQCNICHRINAGAGWCWIIYARKPHPDKAKTRNSACLFKFSQVFPPHVAPRDTLRFHISDTSAYNAGDVHNRGLNDSSPLSKAHLRHPLPRPRTNNRSKFRRLVCKALLTPGINREEVKTFSTKFTPRRLGKGTKGEERQSMSPSTRRSALNDTSLPHLYRNKRPVTHTHTGFLFPASFHVQAFLFITPPPCWSRLHGSPQSSHSRLCLPYPMRFPLLDAPLLHRSKASDEFIKKKFSQKKKNRKKEERIEIHEMKLWTNQIVIL